jgi:hypothetical protein
MKLAIAAAITMISQGVNDPLQREAAFPICGGIVDCCGFGAEIIGSRRPNSIS